MKNKPEWLIKAQELNEEFEKTPLAQLSQKEFNKKHQQRERAILGGIIGGPIGGKAVKESGKLREIAKLGGIKTGELGKSGFQTQWKNDPERAKSYCSAAGKIAGNKEYTCPRCQETRKSSMWLAHINQGTRHCPLPETLEHWKFLVNSLSDEFTLKELKEISDWSTMRHISNTKLKLIKRTGNKRSEMSEDNSKKIGAILFTKNF